MVKRNIPIQNYSHYYAYGGERVDWSTLETNYLLIYKSIEYYREYTLKFCKTFQRDFTSSAALTMTELTAFTLSHLLCLLLLVDIYLRAAGETLIVFPTSIAVKASGRKLSRVNSMTNYNLLFHSVHTHECFLTSVYYDN